MEHMMDREIVYLTDAEVKHGDLYDKSSQKYIKRKDGNKIITKDSPVSYKFEIMDFKLICDYMKYSSIACKWQEDFTSEQPESAIYVRGIKFYENIGIDVPRDKDFSTVTSLIYKSSINMLIILRHKISKETVLELEAYLNSMLGGAKVSFIPSEIVDHFKISYIYIKYSKPGIKLKSVKHAFEQFCSTLKDDIISSIPLNAGLVGPLTFAEAEVKGTVITTPNESKVEFHVCAKNSDNTPNKLQDELANVHAGKNTENPALNMKINPSEVWKQNQGVNEQMSGDWVLTSTLTEKAYKSGTKKDFENISSGKGHGSMKATDDHNVKLERPGLGRGYGTRNGRGRSYGSESVATRIGSNKSSNNVSFVKKETPAINAVDVPSRGSCQLCDSVSSTSKDEEANAVFQRSQTNNNSALSSVSLVQEIKKNFENSEIHHTKNDYLSKQTQLSLQNGTNSSKPQAKSQLDENLISQTNFKHSSTNLEITLEERQQTAKNITTISITHSNEKNQHIDENVSAACDEKTVQNHSESTSCRKKNCAESNCLPNPSHEKRMQGNTESKMEQGNSQEHRFDEIDKLMEENLSEMSHFGCNSDEQVTQTDHQNPPNLASQAISTFSSKMKEENNKKNAAQDLRSTEKMKEKEKAQESLKRKKDSEKVHVTNMNAGKNTASKGKKDTSKAKEKESRKGKSDVDSSNHNADSFGTSSIKAKQQHKLYQALDNDDEKEDIKSPLHSACTWQNKRAKTGNYVIMKTKIWSSVKTARDACGLERKYFGIVNADVPEKVILLLGASGSGKTTLVNFIANYFHGNKSADEELIHVETTVQTSAITAYTFCSNKDDIPITVIDTPGLNDSSGGEVRDHVHSLKTFLANASSNNFEIHAIGFVAQAHLVRLTSSERLVMDYVSTMFGQNVSEHLITFVTFADTQTTPPVIEAMKTYEVTFKQFLKFNNSTLCNGKSDEVDDLDRVYYRVCWKNWRKCLKTLKDLPALSVNAMKAVQSEIYATTVTKSAEKDLVAELKTFFLSYLKDSSFSKEKLEECEQIWELAAVVHRLRSAHIAKSCNTEKILIECSEKVCQANNIPPEKCINILMLAPSKGLTTSGVSVIRTMAPLYNTAKKENLNSAKVSKNITEWSYCHYCNKEHNMGRYEDKGIKKYILGIGPSADVIALKCKDCHCSAALHGVSKVEAPFHLERLLRYSKNRINEVLKKHSIQGFPVQEETFFKFLNHYLHFEYEEFIGALIKVSKK